MDVLGTTIGMIIAAVLIAMAAHFAWRQQVMLRTLRSKAKLPPEQRRFYLRQCQRRLFGSLLLFLLAGMMIGSLFLDFDPLQMSPDAVPQVDRETAKQAVRFLSFYIMLMLMVVLVILVLASVDFWATAKFSVQQQKQLLQEYRARLEADLQEYRHRSEPEA